MVMMEHSLRRDRFSLYGPAMICSVIANVNRDRKRGRKAFTVDDFLPPDPDKQHQKPKEQTPEQMYNWLRIMFGQKKPKQIAAPSE
jgi:hypothetical protein